MRLLLVRHAMPEVRPEVPVHRWSLSPSGRRAAAGLARMLPADGLLVASGEPKAHQTLRATGRPVARDVRFGEVRRNEPYDADYRARRRRYLTGDIPGDWEPPLAVVARFDAAMADHAALAGDRPLVVGTHGMALTVWLAARIGLVDPVGFWSALRMPDLLSVDRDAGVVRRVGAHDDGEAR